MKFAIGFLVGAFTALSLHYHLPRMMYAAFDDRPATPVDYQPKHYYFSGGKRVDNGKV